MIYDVEHLFIWLFAICLYYLMRCLLKFLLHFSNQVIFLLLSFKNSLCILNSYQWVSCECFLPVCVPSSFFWECHEEKFLILILLAYQLFLPWIMTLVLNLKRHHNVQDHLYFLLCYPLGVLVLHFTIRFMIHLELIFMNNVKSVSRLTFCIWMPSCFSTICLLKRLSLLQRIAFATLSKIISLYWWGSISGLSILFCWSIVFSFTNNHNALTTIALR